MYIGLLQTNKDLNKLNKTIDSICKKKGIEKSAFSKLCSYISEKYDSIYYDNDGYYLKSNCEPIMESKYSFFNYIQYMAMNNDNTRHKILYLSPSAIINQYRSSTEIDRLYIIAGLYMYWQLLLPNNEIKFTQPNINVLTWFINNCVTYEETIDSIHLSLWSSIYDGGDSNHVGVCIITCNSYVKKNLSLGTNLIMGTSRFLKSLYKNIGVKYIDVIINIIEKLYYIETNRSILNIMFSMIIEYMTNEQSPNDTVLEAIRTGEGNIAHMIDTGFKVGYKYSLTIDILKYFKSGLQDMIADYINTGNNAILANLAMSNSIPNNLINAILYELYVTKKINLQLLRSLIFNNADSNVLSSLYSYHILFDPEYHNFIKALCENFNTEYRNYLIMQTQSIIDKLSKSIIGTELDLTIANENLQ